jgi:tripartite-type tricarboxylate transporter receptor subunit TctC
MRRWCKTLIAAAAVLGVPAAQAQELPFQGPIRIVAGFAAGGQTDVMARLVADRMQAALKRSVIVENRLGAGGGLAAETVKNATPDGSTILISNTVVMVLAPLQTPDLRYDPVKDFEPILKGSEYQLAVATGAMTKAQTFQEAAAWIKANPDKASYGVPAAGSLPHLYGVRLAEAIKQPMTMVPFRGGPPIVNALLGGHLAIGLGGIGDFAEQHQGKTIRVLAVSGAERNPVLTEIPTFAELGLKGFETNGWNGFFAPKGTPPAVIERYAAVIREALAEPEVKRKLETLGFSVVVGSGPDLMKQIVAERDFWGPSLKAANLTQQ